MRTALLFLAAPLFAQTHYDLLLKGGHVIDAKNNIDAIRDQLEELFSKEIR